MTVPKDYVARVVLRLLLPEQEVASRNETTAAPGLLVLLVVAVSAFDYIELAGEFQSCPWVRKLGCGALRPGRVQTRKVALLRAASAQPKERMDNSI